MKGIKYLIIPALILCFILASCAGNNKQTETTELSNAATDEAQNPAEISEKAMENFIAKISEGNYVLDTGAFQKTNVVSKDLVYTDYSDESYFDSVFMSVNGEAFSGTLEETAIENIAFAGNETAIEAAGPRTLSYWLTDEMCQGNIYNIFYNSVEEPLKFSANDENLKLHVAALNGLNQMAVQYMEDVYLIFDSEDPSTAKIQAVVQDDEVARYYFDDIDITVTFGNAVENELAKNWMDNPVYPEARTEWNDVDEFIFNSIFLPGYGLQAVPFPAFASYALTNDEQNFVNDNIVTLHDAHATESDMAAYIDTLKNEGFTEAIETNEDGSSKTWYRKLLREEAGCYSSINVSYDEGVTILAKKYYDFPKYDKLADINELIKNYGYVDLPDTLKYTSLLATDTKHDLTESWNYFYIYDLGLYVEIGFENEEEIQAYLDDYVQATLDSGFHPVYDDPEAQDSIAYYEAPTGNYSFRYLLEENKVTLLYKHEKLLSNEEAGEMIKAGGFPEISFPDGVVCRDRKMFEKIQYGKDDAMYVTANIKFENTDELGEFFDNYEAALIDAGFGRVAGEDVGMNKPIMLADDDLAKVVGIQVIENADGSALVYYDFLVK